MTTTQRRTTPSVILLVLVSGVTFSIGDASRQAHVKRHQRYGSSKAVLRRQRPYKVQHSKPVTQALLVTNVVTFVSLFNRHNLFRALCEGQHESQIGSDASHAYVVLLTWFDPASLPEHEFAFTLLAAQLNPGLAPHGWHVYMSHLGLLGICCRCL